MVQPRDLQVGGGSGREPGLWIQGEYQILAAMGRGTVLAIVGSNNNMAGAVDRYNVAQLIDTMWRS